jgi:uncharacterized Zn-finger protein
MSSPESADSQIFPFFKLLGPIRGNTYVYDLAPANAQDNLNKKEESIQQTDRLFYVTNNEQHNTHPTVFLFIIMPHSPNCIYFLLPNISFVIDLCAEVFGTVGNKPHIISKKSREILQNKLDNIRHKVKIVMDNEAHERRESVFATYAAAKMAFTRASSNGLQRKCHDGEGRKS